MGKYRIFFLLFVLLATSVASAAPFHGSTYVTHRVQAEDGAQLILFELKGSTAPNAPVVLLEPGLVETAEALDGVAHAFQKAGYRVFIGQARLAGRSSTRSSSGVRNGLEQVALLDLPAHIRAALKISGVRKIHLWGHSMGGIMVLAAFSNDVIRAELEHRIAAATLLTTPHELRSLSSPFRLGIRALLPALKGARKLMSSQTLEPHHDLFDFTLKLKQSGNRIQASLARSIESAAINLGNYIFTRELVDLNHTSPQALRRLWFKEISVLPLDLLIDFAQAVVDGEFVNSEGYALLTPENFKIPVQVLRAENDKLVPWEAQEDLFVRLASPVKRMVNLRGLHHVGAVTNDVPGTDYMPLALEFHARPKTSQKRGLIRDFWPACSKLLKGE